MHEARAALSLRQALVAQEVSARARHELYVCEAVSVEVDPSTDQDLVCEPGEPALCRPLDEASTVHVLEEADAAASSDEEVCVTVCVEVLPGTEAQVADVGEADLNGALSEVTVAGVQVEARRVLFIDDEEVEQPIGVEVAPGELDGGGVCGCLECECEREQRDVQHDGVPERTVFREPVWIRGRPGLRSSPPIGSWTEPSKLDCRIFCKYRGFTLTLVRAKKSGFLCPENRFSTLLE